MDSFKKLSIQYADNGQTFPTLQLQISSNKYFIFPICNDCIIHGASITDMQLRKYAKGMKRTLFCLCINWRSPLSAHMQPAVIKPVYDSKIFAIYVVMMELMEHPIVPPYPLCSIRLQHHKKSCKYMVGTARILCLGLWAYYHYGGSCKRCFTCREYVVYLAAHYISEVCV